MRLATKITAFLLLVSLVISGMAVNSLAASNQIYVSPGSLSVQNGDAFTVSLRINPAGTVNGVKVTLNYSTSRLQYLSIDTSSSAFQVQLQQSISKGSITLQRGVLSSGISTDSLIAKIKFKALAGSGSTSLSLTNVNATSGGSYTNPSAVGGTVNFTSSSTSTPPPPPSSNTTKEPTTSSTTSSSSSTASATPVVVKESAPKSESKPKPKLKFSANISNVEFGKATVNITSNIPVRAYARYGLTNKDLDKKTESTQAGSTGSITLGPKLTPGTKYYYKIFVIDSDGKVLAGNLESFTTKGYTLHITVLDQNNLPLKNTEVELHSSPVKTTTDGQGIATFHNIAPGVHHLEYQSGSHKFSELVYVANDYTDHGDKQSAKPQSSAVILAGFKQSATTENNKNGVPWQLAALILVAIFVVLAATKLIFMRHKLAAKFKKLKFPNWPKAKHVSADNEPPKPSSRLDTLSADPPQPRPGTTIQPEPPKPEAETLQPEAAPKPDQPAKPETPPADNEQDPKS